MAEKKKIDYPHVEILDQYIKLISTLDGIEKKGKSTPYTSLNGHMFSFLDKEGNLSLRVSQKDRDAFLKKYPEAISIQHNTIMKEYILIPESIFNKTTNVKKYFKMSLDYVSGLKPK